MNYEEFPIVKEKYTPICLDMSIKKEETYVPVIVSPIPVITKEIVKEVFISVPYYIYEEPDKPKKTRKKYELLSFPNHWNEKIKAKYKSYYFRARQKGKQFSLTFQEFEDFLSKECRFCGSTDMITIDRIDSNIGYELFNCQPCCYLCNMMKHTQTEYSFLAQIVKVYNYQLNNF